MDNSCFFEMSAPSIKLFNGDSSFGNVVYKNRTFLWIIFSLAALSLFTTLGLPYNGEEAVYTLTSLEMWFNQEWISPIIYGSNYGRPPFLNWLIIPLATLLGWEKVLLSSRLIASLSTVLTASLLIWTVQQLFKEKRLSVWVGIVYLSGDLLFHRGSLAYADPLFSFFVFAAMALAWIALEKKRAFIFILASLCVIGGFLTKAITSYVFYGIALIVLAWQHPNRTLLFSPLSIIAFLISLLFPLLWDYFLSHGNHSQLMMGDVISKFNTAEITRYLLKLSLFPLDTWVRWLPVSGVLLYAWIRAKRQRIPFIHLPFPHFKTFKIALWILFFNYLPYWLVPQSHIRYLLPLYPLFALCLAYLILQLQDQMIRLALGLLIACLALKYLLSFWGYGFIQKKIRGNYRATAQAILTRADSYPLCIEDVNATGLSVAAEIDVLQLPKPPIRRCQPNGTDDFLLLPTSDTNIFPIQNGRLLEAYPLGSHKIYLFCRGKACQK